MSPFVAGLDGVFFFLVLLVLRLPIAIAIILV
jgi:hypothetical protein